MPSGEFLVVRVEESVVENVLAPHKRFDGLWDSIIVEPSLKERLLHQALLALQLRANLPFATSAVHGLLLILGPPGTGKTTLARALPAEIAPLVPTKKARLIEINPHGLMSAEHGQSQQLVMDLLTEHIPSLASDNNPTIVLLDEVESMAVARSAASLSANPADVHRATDAVLAALDRIAQQHPHIVAVATSNFTAALDEALQSRADVVIKLPRPNVEVLTAIVKATLEGYGTHYKKLGALAQSPRLAEVAKMLSGSDARRARKVIAEALALSRETVIDPNRLTVDQLVTAAQLIRSSEQEEGSHGTS
jgi:SpoVK/Ycf46/Vps4 family AAA+-type ATPase